MLRFVTECYAYFVLSICCVVFYGIRNVAVSGVTGALQDSVGQ